MFIHTGERLELRITFIFDISYARISTTDASEQAGNLRAQPDVPNVHQRHNVEGAMDFYGSHHSCAHARTPPNLQLQLKLSFQGID